MHPAVGVAQPVRVDEEEGHDDEEDDPSPPAVDESSTHRGGHVPLRQAASRDVSGQLPHGHRVVVEWLVGVGRQREGRELVVAELRWRLDCRFESSGHAVRLLGAADRSAIAIVTEPTTARTL
jgi:hypothetical protein